MSEKKALYTKSPWTCMVDGEMSKTVHGDYRIYLCNDDSFYPVAYANSEWVDSDDNRRANAHLIAASPELFERFLNSIREQCEKCEALDLFEFPEECEGCPMKGDRDYIDRLESEIMEEENKK